MAKRQRKVTARRKQRTAMITAVRKLQKIFESIEDNLNTQIENVLAVLPDVDDDDDEYWTTQSAIEWLWNCEEKDFSVDEVAELIDARACSVKGSRGSVLRAWAKEVKKFYCDPSMSDNIEADTRLAMAIEEAMSECAAKINAAEKVNHAEIEASEASE